MVFYKIKFKSFPRMKFACSVCTDKYKNIVTLRKNMIELGIVDASITIYRNGETFIRPPKSFGLTMPDADLKCKATKPGEINIISAAISAEFDFEKISTDDTQEFLRITEKAIGEIILPMNMELGNNYVFYESIFREIIFYFALNTEYGENMAISKFLEIMAKISEEFKKTVTDPKKESLGVFYSNKIKKHIELHYNRKIEVWEMARSLGISPNYLSNIFKKETGITITEYVALVRLSEARKRLRKKEGSYEEIAKQVGFSGERMMNRLFNKYYGMNASKCIMADKEISLYHEKPWERANLTKDIYETEK